MHSVCIAMEKFIVNISKKKRKTVQKTKNQNHTDTSESDPDDGLNISKLPKIGTSVADQTTDQKQIQDQHQGIAVPNTDIDENHGSDSVTNDHYDTISKRKRNKISNVWKYFSKSNDRKFAKCCQCGKEYKTSGNTSNLSDHLKRFHPSLSSCNSSSLTASSSHSETSSARSSVRSVSPFFRRALIYEDNSQRKKKLDEALVMMISQDYQPFNIVKDEGFKNFINLLDPRYNLPSPDTLKNKLLKKYFDKASAKLKDILKNVKFVALTSDIWTSVANESYICVSCHFIDEQFEVKRTILATNKIEESKTSENIAKVLREICEEWGIFDKISGIVTDNAANMVRACELLKKKHVPCFAHSMNLAVQENFKKDFVQPLMKKCKGIVTYFKSSPAATTKFNEEQKVLWKGTINENKEAYKLIQEVPTRWNSSFYMIERILLTSSALNNTLLSLRNAPQPILAEDIAVLKDFEVCLKIFENATKKVSGYKYVSISMLIPITVGIYNYLMFASARISTEEGTKFCQGLLESVRTRLFPYELRTIPRIATILDPRFKKDGFRNKENADQASCFLENELSLILNVKSALQDQVSHVEDLQTEEPENDSFLFGFMKEKIKEKSRIAKVDAIILKRQYLERQNLDEHSDPLLFWKLNGMELGPMQEVVLKYFCIPGTSVESERNFSSAGQILSDRRSRLKAKYVNMLIFINKNSWLL